jgi:hypothetical protein
MPRIFDVADSEARHLLERASKNYVRAIEHLANAAAFAASTGSTVQDIADVIDATPETAQAILDEWSSWPQR